MGELKTTRRRHRTRRINKKDKVPYFMTLILGPYIYRNLFHEAVSFAIDSPPGAPPNFFVAEMNLFLKPSHADDLKAHCMSDDEFDNNTPGTLCLANHTNYGFRGKPRIIATDEDVDEAGQKGVLVKMKYNATDIKRVES